MTFKRLSAYNASNTADLAGKIKDQLVAAGWTLYDDQSGAGTPYYIMKSTGEYPHTKVPCYLELKWSATYVDKIEITMWLHWDNSAHSGTVQIGGASNAYLYTDDDASFYAWIWCNMDFLVVGTKLGSTYYSSFCIRMTPSYKAFGQIQSAVTSGSGKTLQLGKGQATGFVAGTGAQMLCLDGSVGRDSTLLVTDVDTALDQITIDNLTYNFPAGSVIGYCPYPWAIGRSNTSNLYSLWSGDGTGNYATGGTMTLLVGYQYVDPEELTNMYFLIPHWLNRSGSGLIGYLDRWLLYSPLASGTNEDTVALGIIQGDTVATGGGTNTLEDTAQSWTTDEHVGKAVIVITGTGAGQIRTITANTATELTVDDNWSTQPDATSHYVICEEAYRHFGHGSVTYSRAFIEGGNIPGPPVYEVTTTSTTTTSTTTTTTSSTTTTT